MQDVVKMFIVVFVLSIITFVSIIGIDRVVEKEAIGKIFNSTGEIPYNKVGLLLGTCKMVAGGRLNLYYKYRIEAAVKLYNAGKIDFILVSGDNSTHAYDETTTMQNDLIKKGVPAERIFLDYAGFRTLDSVIRSQQVFGQDSITVISQQFHNERALFIAERKNISAIGYNAKDVSVNYGFKTQLRERFARIKMVMDLIFGTKPKFLGKKIEIK